MISGAAAFYRAMSLHRRGLVDEARKLATGAAATMKPLPADDKNPLAGGADHDDLILWLACKEAKALIGFDPPPAAPSSPTTNDRVAGTWSAPRVWNDLLREAHLRAE